MSNVAVTHLVGRNAWCTYGLKVKLRAHVGRHVNLDLDWFRQEFIRSIACSQRSHLIRRRWTGIFSSRSAHSLCALFPLPLGSGSYTKLGTRFGGEFAKKWAGFCMTLDLHISDGRISKTLKILDNTLGYFSLTTFQALSSAFGSNWKFLSKFVLEIPWMYLRLLECFLNWLESIQLKKKSSPSSSSLKWYANPQDPSSN